MTLPHGSYPEAQVSDIVAACGHVIVQSTWRVLVPSNIASLAAFFRCNNVLSLGFPSEMGADMNTAAPSNLPTDEDF